MQRNELLITFTFAQSVGRHILALLTLSSHDTTQWSLGNDTDGITYSASPLYAFSFPVLSIANDPSLITKPFPFALFFHKIKSFGARKAKQPFGSSTSFFFTALFSCGCRNVRGQFVVQRSPSTSTSLSPKHQ